MVVRKLSCFEIAAFFCLLYRWKKKRRQFQSKKVFQLPWVAFLYCLYFRKGMQPMLFSDGTVLCTSLQSTLLRMIKEMQKISVTNKGTRQKRKTDENVARNGLIYENTHLSLQNVSVDFLHFVLAKLSILRFFDNFSLASALSAWTDFCH